MRCSLGCNGFLRTCNSCTAAEFLWISAAAQAVVEVCIGSPIAHSVNPLVLCFRGEFVERDLRTLRAEVLPRNVGIAARGAVFGTLRFFLRTLCLRCLELSLTLLALLLSTLGVCLLDIHLTADGSQLFSNLRSYRRWRWCKRNSQRQAFLARSFQFGLSRCSFHAWRWCAKWNRLPTQKRLRCDR